MSAIRNDYRIDLWRMTEGSGETVAGGNQKSVAFLLRDQIDGAAAKSAAHHAGAGNTLPAGQFHQEIQLRTAHLIEAAEAIVGLVHPLSYPLIITLFERIADVQDAGGFADYIFCTAIILFRDFVPNLVEPGPAGIAEEFDLRVPLADSGGGVFTGGPALIVSRRGQLMLDAGVKQYESVALGIKGKILVFQCFTIAAEE